MKNGVGGMQPEGLVAAQPQEGRVGERSLVTRVAGQPAGQLGDRVRDRVGHRVDRPAVEQDGLRRVHARRPAQEVIRVADHDGDQVQGKVVLGQLTALEPCHQLRAPLPGRPEEPLHERGLVHQRPLQGRRGGR